MFPLKRGCELLGVKLYNDDVMLGGVYNGNRAVVVCGYRGANVETPEKLEWTKKKI